MKFQATQAYLHRDTGTVQGWIVEEIDPSGERQIVSKKLYLHKRDAEGEAVRLANAHKDS